MPQLKEDEWPKDGQPTTTEAEQDRDSAKPTGKDAPPVTSPEYPPKLPPDALPTKDRA
jgi:hypothetical protein